MKASSIGKTLLTWKFWKEMLTITIAMSIAAAAVYYFLMPSKLVVGSISGLSIVISGIQLITKEPLTARNLSIVSVALGVGYGMGANSGILSQAPEAVRLIFGGSGIVPAAMVAILLNILLPKEKAEL